MAAQKVKKRSQTPAEKGATTSIRATFTSMDSADKIAWGSLLAIVLLVPLAMSNFTFLGFQLPFTNDQFDVPKIFLLRGASLIALAAWSWGLLRRGGKIRYSPVNFLVLAFLAWVTLSSVLSIHVPTAILGKYRRFEGLVTFANYGLIMFLTMQYADSARRIRAVAKVFIISMSIVALYGVAQSLGIDAIDWGTLPFEVNRAFSTYGNPDMLGGALAFAAPIAISMALSERDSRWRSAYWVGFLLISYCLIVSFVRGAWIGAFVGLVAFAVAALVQKVEWKKVDFGFLGVTGAAVVAAVVRSLSAESEVMNFASRFASIFETESGSGLTRLQIWSAARRAIADSPLWGHGPDTFRLLFPKYKPVEYVAAAGYRSVADNVHNYPLQLATGIGIVGAGLMYLVFGWVAVVAGKAVFRRGEKSGSQLMLAGLWAGCAAYIAHLMFGLSLAGTTFFLWMALGLLISPSAKSREISAPSWGTVAAGVTLAIMLVGLILNIQFIRADNAYLKSAMLMQSNPVEAATYAEKAIAINPYNDIYRAQPGIAWGQYGSILASAGSYDQAVVAFGNAESRLLDVIAFCPAEYDNYVFLASVYNTHASMVPGTGYEEKALEVALKAVEIEKYGPGARVQLARAYYALGDAEKAVDELAYAVEMDPNFTEAASLLESLKSEISSATGE